LSAHTNLAVRAYPSLRAHDCGRTHQTFWGAAATLPGPYRNPWCSR